MGVKVKRDFDADSILLTRRELQIMKVVWNDHAVTVKEVQDAISKDRAVAYTTILTFMKILEEKGALSHARQGRTFVYKPVLTREQATRNQVRDVVERYFDGCPGKLVAAALKSENASPEQLRNVRSMLTGALKHLPGKMEPKNADSFAAKESISGMLERASRKPREHAAAGVSFSASASEN